MFPQYKLDEPKAGQKVSATTIRNLIKSVKALQPSVGYGMRISKNSNGVMYELDKQVIQKVSKTKMPFDCTLISHTADSMSFEVHILCGKLYYGIENGIAEIQPEDLIGEDYWDLNLSLTDNLTIGIRCNYDEEAETSIPESFTVGEIPSDPGGGVSVSEGGWMDVNGLHCFPLVRFKKVGPEQEYGGPYIFSIRVPSDDEGSSDTEDEQKYDTYYAIQSHHGDVLFDNNDCAAWVGEVKSGGNGTFGVGAADSSGTDADVIHVVEIAGCATLPYGSRVIVHRITTESLASGNMQSGS